MKKMKEKRKTKKKKIRVGQFVRRCVARDHGNFSWSSFAACHLASLF